MLWFISNRQLRKPHSFRVEKKTSKKEKIWSTNPTLHNENQQQLPNTNLNCRVLTTKTTLYNTVPCHYLITPKQIVLLSLTCLLASLSQGVMKTDTENTVVISGLFIRVEGEEEDDDEEEKKWMTAMSPDGRPFRFSLLRPSQRQSLKPSQCHNALNGHPGGNEILANISHFWSSQTHRQSVFLI